MIEIAVTSGAGLLVGALIGRWLILPIPAVLLAIWVALAYFFGERSDRGEADAWILGLFIGGAFVCVLTVGLALGVLARTYVADRRQERDRASAAT